MRRSTAAALSHLGIVAMAEGDNARATTLLEESQALYREMSDKQGIAYCLEGLAARGPRGARRQRVGDDTLPGGVWPCVGEMGNSAVVRPLVWRGWRAWLVRGMGHMR